MDSLILGVWTSYVHKCMTENSAKLYAAIPGVSSLCLSTEMVQNIMKRLSVRTRSPCLFNACRGVQRNAVFTSEESF